MDNCIFCKITKGEANAYKVYEDEHTIAFLDINPVVEYHTLVIPKKHFVNIFDIPAEVLTNVMQTVKRVVDLYSKKLGLENAQIIHNAGAEAQQDVFHLHVHIVPRKKGDNQNIRWVNHPELRERFDELLKKIKD